MMNFKYAQKSDKEEDVEEESRELGEALAKRKKGLVSKKKIKEEKDDVDDAKEEMKEASTKRGLPEHDASGKIPRVVTGKPFTPKITRPFDTSKRRMVGGSLKLTNCLGKKVNPGLGKNAAEKMTYTHLKIAKKDGVFSKLKKGIKSRVNSAEAESESYRRSDHPLASPKKITKAHTAVGGIGGALVGAGIGAATAGKGKRLKGGVGGAAAGGALGGAYGLANGASAGLGTHLRNRRVEKKFKGVSDSKVRGMADKHNPRGMKSLRKYEEKQKNKKK